MEVRDTDGVAGVAHEPDDLTRRHLRSELHRCWDAPRLRRIVLDAVDQIVGVHMEVVGPHSVGAGDRDGRPGDPTVLELVSGDDAVERRSQRLTAHTENVRALVATLAVLPTRQPPPIAVADGAKDRERLKLKPTAR